MPIERAAATIRARRSEIALTVLSVRRIALAAISPPATRVTPLPPPTLGECSNGDAPSSAVGSGPFDSVSRVDRAGAECTGNARSARSTMRPPLPAVLVQEVRVMKRVHVLGFTLVSLTLGLGAPWF